MTGSFNRLLAKAPKRRLQRRGGAWQEGDFHFRGCFGKQIKWDEARRMEFRVSGSWGPLVATRVGWEGGCGQTLFCPTKHYRPFSRLEFVFDVRTTTRLPAWFSFAALRSLFSRFNSSLILFLDARRNIFYSESVISCRLPDFLNIAVSELVSIRDGLGACVADDFVWSVCGRHI